jgi:hypothetical protein
MAAAGEGQRRAKARDAGPNDNDVHHAS